jgi:hypothetical protein
MSTVMLKEWTIFLKFFRVGPPKFCELTSLEGNGSTGTKHTSVILSGNKTFTSTPILVLANVRQWKKCLPQPAQIMLQLTSLIYVPYLDVLVGTIILIVCVFYL